MIDERMQEFNSSEIARSILKQTAVMLATIKEGIMELLEDHLEAFLAIITADSWGPIGSPNLVEPEGLLGKRILLPTLVMNERR